MNAMKKFLFLLLGLTIAVGAPAGVNNLKDPKRPKLQRTHVKFQPKSFQSTSKIRLRGIAPDIITDQPEGQLVTMNRTGYSINSYGRPTAINSQVNIVYAPDGKTVYIQDPVFAVGLNTWVRGTIADGKIHVPLNQYVYSEEGYGVLLRWGTCTATNTVDPYDDPFVFTADDTATECTYTIDGNKMTMDNTTAGNNGNGAVGLAIMQDDGNPFFMMEYNAVFSMPEPNGDMNGDGEYNISDVIIFINYLVNNGADGFMIENADYNGDSEINVTDVVDMINYLLNNV